MRTSLLLVAGLACVAQAPAKGHPAHAAGTPKGPSTRPLNLVFIMSDDHTRQAMGCYGGTVGRTPQLDRLAAEGVRFNQATCTNAVCGPSRAVMLTGRHSHINGMLDNHRAFDGSQDTFPKRLQAAGYQTALVGKWHLGSTPTGFDHWSILPGQGDYYNPDFMTPEGTRRHEGYVTDLITDQAVAWLKGRDRTRPFCLLVHHKAPHRNWQPAERHLRHYEGESFPMPATFDAPPSPLSQGTEMSVKRHFMPGYDLKVPQEGGYRPGEDRSAYGANLARMTPIQREAWDRAYGPVAAAFHAAPPTGRALELWQLDRYLKDYARTADSLDEGVGRVLDTLKAEGLDENTVVVYTSDQGFFLGERGLYDKRLAYEEALGIPLLVRWPGVKPGTSDALVQNLDFAPTFLEAAGLKPSPGMQGRSFKAVLQGANPAAFRSATYYHFFEYPGEHKAPRHMAVRTRRHKLIRAYHGADAWELYDLQKDPHELKNLWEDPAHRKVRAQMLRLLKRLRQEAKDTDETRFLPQPR